MPIGPRQLEAWNAFRANALKVMEARGMKRNHLASEVERRKLASNKTVYNILDQAHPPKLASWLAVAEVLNLPLWLLLIPDIPKDLLEGPAREEFLRTVKAYLDCDAASRTNIANVAATYGDICRAKTNSKA